MVVVETGGESKVVKINAAIVCKLYSCLNKEFFFLKKDVLNKIEFHEALNEGSSELEHPRAISGSIHQFGKNCPSVRDIVRKKYGRYSCSCVQ